MKFQIHYRLKDPYEKRIEDVEAPTSHDAICLVIEREDKEAIEAEARGERGYSNISWIGLEDAEEEEKKRRVEEES
jgi:hypothetical protein